MAHANTPDKLPFQAVNILRALKGGQSVAALVTKFNERSVLKALSDISDVRPADFEKIFGTPGTDERILADACIPSSLTLPMHQMFGHVGHVKHLTGTAANDHEVFHAAWNAGFSAIITSDGANKGMNDLCVIARQNFNLYKSFLLPGVVVVPSHTEKARAVLTERQEEVRQYLKSRKEGRLLNVLNLC